METQQPVQQINNQPNQSGENLEIKTVEDLEPKNVEPVIDYKTLYEKLHQDYEALSKNYELSVQANNKLFQRLTAKVEDEKSALENILKNF